MLTELRQSERARFGEYRERGLAWGLCTDRIDTARARAYGAKLMNMLGRDCGAVITMPGPLYTWLAVLSLCSGDVKDQVRDQVWSQVGSQIEDQVWSQAWSQVWDQVGYKVRVQVVKQVRDQVWSQVGSQIEDQVWSQVVDQVEFQVRNEVRDQVWNQVGFVWPYMCGQFWAGWVAWADYCREVLSLELCDYSIIAEQVEFGPIYPLRSVCVICDRPSEIHIKDGLLHRDGGPAVEYLDGLCMWSLHGVRVEKWLAETPWDEIDPVRFAAIQNAEVRREFVRKVGMERIAAACGSTVLDRTPNGVYSLLSLDLGGDTGKWPYLKMLNPSLKVWHVEAVPREITTVRAALKWRNQSGLEPTQLT